MQLQTGYLFFNVGIIFFLMLGFAFLFALSILVRDFDIIKKSPFVFVMETALVSVLPAIPILFFAFSRGVPFETALNWLYGLSLKFAVFHVLFQVSGLYTYMFSQ